MTVQTLGDMFLYQLEEMYYIEDRLVEVLGEMSSDVENDKLATGFRDHQEETRKHVQRLEDVFAAIDRQPEHRKSETLEALVDERERFHEQAERQEMRDLFDIQAGMKNERMEMTGYEGLLALAQKLDYGDEVTEPLEDNLSAERSTFYELQGLSKGSKLKSMVSQMMG